MKKLILFLALLVTLTLILVGCFSNQGNQSLENSTINLVITSNFGTENILSKEMQFRKNISVMDMLLDSGAEVDTGYGGSFIKGINGLTSESGGVSGVRKDWFYYVNGIFSDVGALDYFPEPGEMILWDYHPWKMAMGGSTAIIGSYPEPFLHGYMGKTKTTYIMCYPEEKELSTALLEGLKSKGVQEIEIIEVNNELLEKRKGPTILLGSWDKIKDNAYIRKLNDKYVKNGMAVHFTDTSVELLNYCGEIVEKLEENSGVLAATGEGSGDDSPLWLVSGLDDAGFQKATDLLINHPEKISGMFSAVINNDQIISLPLMGE